MGESLPCGPRTNNPRWCCGSPPRLSDSGLLYTTRTAILIIKKMKWDNPFTQHFVWHKIHEI